MSEAPSDFEHDYGALKRAVEAKGFFSTAQPIKRPGDRLVVASQRFERGLTGVSFWIARRESGWFVATWTPHIYRIPDAAKVEAAVLEALHTGRGTPYDFTDSVKSAYGLVEVSDAEFDRA